MRYASVYEHDPGYMYKIRLRYEKSKGKYIVGTGLEGGGIGGMVR